MPPPSDVSFHISLKSIQLLGGVFFQWFCHLPFRVASHCSQCACPLWLSAPLFVLISLAQFVENCTQRYLKRTHEKQKKGINPHFSDAFCDATTYSDYINLHEII